MARAVFPPCGSKVGMKISALASAWAGVGFPGKAAMRAAQQQGECRAFDDALGSAPAARSALTAIAEPLIKASRRGLTRACNQRVMCQNSRGASCGKEGITIRRRRAVELLHLVCYVRICSEPFKEDVQRVQVACLNGHEHSGVPVLAFVDQSVLYGAPDESSQLSAGRFRVSERRGGGRTASVAFTSSRLRTVAAISLRTAEPCLLATTAWRRGWGRGLQGFASSLRGDSAEQAR